MKRSVVVIESPMNAHVIEEDFDESKLQAQECLIESYVSMISPGTELSRAFGLKEHAKYPVYPGYATVGKILKVGSLMSHLKFGDRVLFSGIHANLQLFDVEKSDGSVLYRLDPRLSDEEGAFLMMAWISMNGVLNADVKLGDTVAIFGMGNIGLLCGLLYQQIGAHVIGLDPVAYRAQKARDLGIQTVIELESDQQVDALMKLTQQKGADIVVDATGMSAVIVNAIEVAAFKGQVILLGTPRVSHTTNITPMLNAIHMKLLRVMGALNRGFPYENELDSRLSVHHGLDTLSDLLIRKVIDAKQFITHRIKPQDIWSAYDALMNDKEHTLAVIIEWPAKARD